MQRERRNHVKRFSVKPFAAKLGIAGAISGGALLVLAAPASAIHCEVDNKPIGAGAITADELLNPNEAGKSGNLYYTGAFVTVPTTGEDTFIRGPKPFLPFAPDVQGTGSLPDEPHHNGHEENGVTLLDESPE